MYNNEELKQQAPAAFRSKEAGAELGASKHYQFMTTHDVIDGLTGMGWVVHEAKQQKSKKNPETTKHMLRFRNETYGTLGKNGNIPEILFINSHDRTSSLNFHVGIFRVIGSKHFVVADKTFDNFRIRHMGTSFEAVREIITQITNALPDVFKTINKFEGVTLDKNQQQEMAMKSLALRFPEYLDAKTNELRPDLITKSVDIDDILKPQRGEDNGDSLWLTLNRVQENIIQGGFQRIGETDKSKAVRPLTNIRLNLMVNKGIWQVANDMA